MLIGLLNCRRNHHSEMYEPTRAYKELRTRVAVSTDFGEGAVLWIEIFTDPRFLCNIVPVRLSPCAISARQSTRFFFKSPAQCLSRRPLAGNYVSLSWCGSIRSLAVATSCTRLCCAPRCRLYRRLLDSRMLLNRRATVLVLETQKLRCR